MPSPSNPAQPYAAGPADDPKDGRRDAELRPASAPSPPSPLSHSLRPDPPQPGSPEAGSEAADPRRQALDPALPLAGEQRQLFQRVLGALRRGGVSCAVAGAFAFRHYTGIWRFTKDLDIFLPAERIPVALTLCRAVGLVTEVTDPVWLAKAWAGDYFVDLISGMSNGVFWVTPEWIEHGHAGDILGQPVRLLAPEEMILSKIFVTRRNRFDGSDICHLLYCTGSHLDWNRLLRATGEHWEMLLWHLLLFRYVYPEAARAHVPPWLWEELQARLDAPPTPDSPRFRGSLVDPLMFEADIHLWGFDNLEDRTRRQRLAAPPQPCAPTSTPPPPR